MQRQPQHFVNLLNCRASIPGITRKGL
jgi:hypothetical protein